MWRYVHIFKSQQLEKIFCKLFFYLHCMKLVTLMIILLEKVAPVPLFTDNFQQIFTIRRYHPRCENLTWFCRVSNAVLDDWPIFLFMSPSTEKFYDKKRPFLDFLKKSRNFLIKVHYEIHKEGVPLKNLAGVAVSILELLIFLKFTQTLPFL